tara:strand:- start:852 stop:1049 length:198 start_codon:yes stop_codon:yes gene_type:complete
MTLMEQAVEAAVTFPANKNAPKEVKEIFAKAKGREKDDIASTVEILMVRSGGKKELLSIIDRYWE